MPPHHELEKIAVELGVAGALAITGWWAGRSRTGRGFIRCVANVVVFSLLLDLTLFLLPVLGVRFVDVLQPTSFPFGKLWYLATVMLLVLVVAMAACAGCVAGIAHAWTARRVDWFVTLLIASAVPLALAVSLFAINLSHVEPNPRPVLMATLLCALSIPATLAYAFVGTRRAARGARRIAS